MPLPFFSSRQTQERGKEGEEDAALQEAAYQEQERRRFSAALGHAYRQLSGRRRRTARAGASLPTLDPIPEDITETLPVYVLVVHDKVLRINPAIRSSIEELLKGKYTVEVYPLSATRTDFFVDRFPCVQEPRFTFITGELYRQHPVVQSRYIALNEYQRVIDDEIMREALYMLGDLGAKVVEITASSSSHIGRERNTDLSVSMPEAVPVAGGSGATVSHGRTTDSSRGTAQTTTFSFPVPKYFPFRNPTHWYYENGLQFPDLQAVVPKLQEQRGERTISLSFAETGEFKSLRELQVDLAQVVGIATVEKRSTLAEFKYTFRVEFYDEASFAEARNWDAPPCSRGVEQARWSLSSLGSQRTQYWPKRLSFREDLRLPGEGVVPIEEWLMNYDGVNTIPELFRAQELSNMLYVPFVLYGPRGIDNSTVLFTWQFAVTKSVRTLHTVDTWKQWYTVLSNGRPRGQQRWGYETFMQNVRFDPRGGGVAGSEGALRGARDAETFEQMSEKDVVKLIMYDTPDGSSIDLDSKGIEYPHGLKILVLNGGMVNTLRKEREARKAGEPGDLTDDELEEHEHAWKQAELLVGPERPPAPDGVSIVVELDRYPPVACILKFDIGGELVPDEIVPADERNASVAMVTNELGITQAWPLVALPAPASKADAVALTTQLRGKKEVYEKRMEILEEVAAEAVDVLNNLFSFVTELEFTLRRQADRAAAIGKHD